MAANAQPTHAVSEQAKLCPNCGTDLAGEFCHNCGEKRFHEHDLAVKHFLLHALDELTHLDSKIFATFRYLVSRPGYLTQEYTSGRKSKYMKPLSLFLLAVALLFLADSIYPRSAYDLNYINHNDKSGKLDAVWSKLAARKHMPKELLIERIQEKVHRVATAAQLANVAAMALVLAVLYRRRYFVEHLVFSFHFLSFTYLSSALLSPLFSALGVRTIGSWILFGIETAVFFGYLLIGLLRVYRQDRAKTFVKTLLTYAVAQTILIVTPIVVLLGALISAAKS